MLGSVLSLASAGCGDVVGEPDAEQGCQAPETDCNGVCVNTAQDDDNCGICDNACPGETSCMAGECRCQAGLVYCEAGCVDPLIDQTHCGATDDCAGTNAGLACGVDTPEGDTCSDGFCVGDRELIGNGDFAEMLTGWAPANNPVGDNDTVSTFEVINEVAQNQPSSGPSARVLVQDFTVPEVVMGAVFSLDFAQVPSQPLDPGNVTVIEKDPGDMSGNGLNQNAFRIDLISPTEDQFYAPILFELFTPVDSVGTLGMLEPVEVTDPGLLEFLQSYQGQALRLRIAHVESTFPWTAQFDNVSLSVVGP